MRVACGLALLVLAAAGVSGQTKKSYDGPRPVKADVPYLLEAGRLTEVESSEAQQKDEKDAVVYTVPGSTSPTRTPMPEPIFLFKSDRINPERLSLYRMESKGGNRVISISTRGKAKSSQKPVFLMVNRLEAGLYRVEVNEYIENGEYCLTPEGSNKTFCFTTY